ncbi:metallophosphoesterase family protein [Humibacter albus]|uniref:metallophosphoesterase family protein n=1 Tax=Humibacter albus TaxID=427754 RepID=UPI0003B3AB1B|nr:metallophosphoesterase family protein [Humibacter albus]
MPRIALISDVHGNTPALLAVLDAISADGIEMIVNLGDVASGGVDPRGTLDVLRTRTDIVNIKGNHERQLLTLEADRMGLSDRLASHVLTDDDRAWLDTLPARLEIAPGVLAFHGAPDDDLCYLLETVDAGARNALRQASDDEVVERLGASAGQYDLYACGHTHLQRTRWLRDGSLIVNPGSVGWPAYEDDAPVPHRVEAGSPHARYTVIEKDAGGWHAEERRVDYDLAAAVTLAHGNGRPDVAHALRTGFVGVDRDRLGRAHRRPTRSGNTS